MLSTSDRGSWRALSLSTLLLLILQVKLSSSTSPCHIQLDMAIAVDTSSSCTQAEFTQLLSKVKSLVAKFPVGPKYTRLALIGMSQSAQVLVNFDGVSSLSDFNSAVNRLRLTSGRTEISQGMKLARESVLNTARNSPVPRLVVLVKDQRCSDRAMGSSDSELALIKSEAAAVRSMGGIVHVVGIGGLWNSQELNCVFGSKYALFKSFKATKSIKSLSNKVCLPTNCKNSGHSMKLGTCFGTMRQVLTVNVAGALNSAGSGVCRQEIARSLRACTVKQTCNKMERSLGSCQADGNLNIVDMLQFFNRKTQSCVTDVDKHKVNCSRARECESQVADVMIVLDRSASLHNKYATLVDAAVELIKALPIGDKYVHIGVVSFSGEYKNNVLKNVLATVVELGEEFDKSKIQQKVLQMKNTTTSGILYEYEYFQSTYTGEALKQVDATLRSKGRRDVSKAVIIITDGESSDPKVLFQSVSNLKNNGVTIYAIGVHPIMGYLNMNELTMMTSPESDKNLFILDNFNQLEPWAKHFSTTLCMELKPNPKLCDAGVQLKSISACVQSKMQTTLVKFEYDSARKCVKHFKNTVVQQCKGICVDPIDGNNHMEGESWANMCHEFRCDRAGNPTMSNKTTKCVAADFSCKAVGSAPFQCRNTDGEVRDNCRCVDKGGEAVLVVDNPN